MTHSAIRLSAVFLLGGIAMFAAAAAHAEEADYILHSFGQGADGQGPVAPLIKVNGLFYGTTPNGGTNGTGTIYSMTPQGVEKVLYSFGGTPGDGQVPYCALTYVNGTFYGTTSLGGSEKQGTVFSFTPDGTEIVLYSFKGGGLGSDPNDGYRPSSELFYFDGALYGTADGGGDGGYNGVVFKVRLDGAESIVHTFAGGPSDGATPNGGLIESSGLLYGVTAAGGSTGNGTVYSLAATGSYSVVYSFQGGKEDGSYPSGDLLDIDGKLYGTTRQAGFYSQGTVYAVTPGGAEQVIHSFGTLDGKRYPGAGATPYSGLIEVGGLLYGTTAIGGSHNGGVVFSMTLQGIDSVIHSSLGGVDGGGLYASLKFGGDALYGVRYGDGLYDKGVAFRLIIPAR